MMTLLLRLRDKVAASGDPLGGALALAAAANVIDFGTTPSVTQTDVERQLEEALSTQLSTEQVARFERAVATSTRHLYIADNAGEIVLDRLLIQHLMAHWDPVITLVVRGGPIINDALRRDAQESWDRHTGADYGERERRARDPAGRVQSWILQGF
jgi:uncharacterized protein with ATP-grasp and redox domains